MPSYAYEYSCSNIVFQNVYIALWNNFNENLVQTFYKNIPDAH